MKSVIILSLSHSEARLIQQRKRIISHRRSRSHASNDSNAVSAISDSSSPHRPPSLLPITDLPDHDGTKITDSCITRKGTHFCPDYETWLRGNQRLGRWVWKIFKLRPSTSESFRLQLYTTIALSEDRSATILSLVKICCRPTAADHYTTTCNSTTFAAPSSTPDIGPVDLQLGLDDQLWILSYIELAYRIPMEKHHDSISGWPANEPCNIR